MTSIFAIQAYNHPIKSVTVFKSSKAEVVRSFNLTLKKGQNKIEIRGLSSSIDTHSVRVSGLGQACLFDVVCTLANDKASSYAPDSSSEVTRSLLVKKAALESQRVIREHEYQILLQYAKTLTGEHITPTQMTQFMESFIEQRCKAVDAATELNEQIVKITRDIEVAKEKAASKEGKALGQVDIVIFADTETTVALKLTYIVGNVQWIPTYELQATTENSKPSSSVTLHYRARIIQSTGEDWNNVSLTLNTNASDSFVEGIPQLKSLKIHQGSSNGAGLFGSSGDNNAAKQSLPEPNSHSQSQSSSGKGATASTSKTDTSGDSFTSQPGAPPVVNIPSGSTPTASGSAFGSTATTAPSGSTATGDAAAESHPLSDKSKQADRPSPILKPTPLVSERPVALSFSAQGDSTIPSDGIEHQVSIAVLPFNAKVSYITIPRIDSRVFLQCEIMNTSKYQLLAGPVAVFLDDCYVSKTTINDINMGDRFGCALGVDAATIVTYSCSGKPVKSTVPPSVTFIESTDATTYTTKISVHNKHQFDITDLIVRDIIPTSDDSRVKIILHKPVGLAGAKDGETVDLKNDGLKVGWEPLLDGKGGEKEGKFEWKWKVKSGIKVNLEAEWEVKVPADGANWLEAFSELKI
ncbi:hypothetical protein CPB84DRAFT_1677822 [Gymnopilus junonius]|uniref:Uncharacterized protein n=1 Tax=Gymnopilus junonius TaxID=109634 RepID=A0A9P5NP86_GYMJU|nr:hypothetical protein CPB84DRAFT_1677822 [Gymnopilus junonius]